MTVSDQIIQVIDALCEKFGMAIDWTSENVIPYITTLCEKLIAFEIWTSVAWIAIMVVLSVTSFVLVKIFSPTFKKGLEENKRNYDAGWEFATVFTIVGLVIFYLMILIVVGTQIMDIIKCVTFPEMFVFEYIQGIINSAG